MCGLHISTETIQLGNSLCSPEEAGGEIHIPAKRVEKKFELLHLNGDFHVISKIWKCSLSFPSMY